MGLSRVESGFQFPKKPETNKSKLTVKSNEKKPADLYFSLHKSPAIKVKKDKENIP